MPEQSGVLSLLLRLHFSYCSGIAEADRSHVIERFVRLPQSAAEPGSGLGLSLAAAVARVHGGELRLDDNAPGLRAAIDLPRGGSSL